MRNMKISEQNFSTPDKANRHAISGTAAILLLIAVSNYILHKKRSHSNLCVFFKTYPNFYLAQELVQTISSTSNAYFLASGLS